MNQPPIGVILEEIEQELYKMFPFLCSWKTAKIYTGVKEVFERVLTKHLIFYADYVTQKVIEEALTAIEKKNLERKQEKKSVILIKKPHDDPDN